MTTLLEIKQNDSIKNYFQNKKSYDALCLSGGGVNGYFFLGVLHYLDIYNDVGNFKYYFGTSVGSAICILLIIGFKPIEILKFVCKDNISEIFFPSVNSIKEGYGLYDIQMLKYYLENMILTKYDNEIPTFKELYEKTNKFFCCTSYCLNDNNNQTYFNHLTTPNIKISDGVIASCTIPFIFSKNYFDNKYYIDGAFFNNYPIDKLYEYINKDLLKEEIKILGIYISSKKNQKINSFTDYISSILNFFVDLQINNKKELIDNLIKDKKLDHIEIEKGHSFDFKDTISSRVNLYCDGIKLLKEYYLSKIN